MANEEWTRRSFLKLSAGAVAAGATAALAADAGFAAGRKKHLPIGLELYSVRNDLARDLFGTVTAVAKQGYEVVEFYAPYASWTPDYAHQVRKLLDDLNIKCLSTHNNRDGLEGDGLKKAIDLNQIIGSTTIVMASAGRTDTVDDWKRVADTLSAAAETLKPLKMRPGYHNHQAEFTAKGGFRPMPFLAANTSKEVTLQFDVGTAVEAGYDPVQWVKENPGRIRSMHLKDWGKGPGRGYSVLFGEGDVPWGPLLDAAEHGSGVEYLLIEQEGSRLPELETAARCLESYKRLREG